MGRRFLSGLLALCLLLSLGMTCAFTDGTGESVPEDAGQAAEYPPSADSGSQEDLSGLSQVTPDTGDGQAPADTVPEEVTAPQAETVPQEEDAPLDEAAPLDEDAPLDVEEEEAEEDAGVMLAAADVPTAIALAQNLTVTVSEAGDITVTGGNGGEKYYYLLTDNPTGTVNGWEPNTTKEVAQGALQALGANISSPLEKPSLSAENKGQYLVVIEVDADDTTVVAAGVSAPIDIKDPTAKPAFSGGPFTAKSGNTTAELTLSSSYGSVTQVDVYDQGGEKAAEIQDATCEGNKITLKFSAPITGAKIYQISVTEDGKRASEKSDQVTVNPAVAELSELKVNDSIPPSGNLSPSGSSESSPAKLTADLEEYAESFTITATFTGEAKYSTSSAAEAKNGEQLTSGNDSKTISANKYPAKTNVFIYVLNEGVEGYYQLEVTNPQEQTQQPVFNPTTVTATDGNTKAEFTLKTPPRYTGSPVTVKVYNSDGGSIAGGVTGEYVSDGNKITLSFTSGAITEAKTYKITVTENGKLASDQSAEVTVQPRTPDPKADKTTVTALAGNKSAEITLSNSSGDYNSHSPTVTVYNDPSGEKVVDDSVTAKYDEGKITLTFKEAINGEKKYQLSMTNTGWVESENKLTVTVKPGPTLKTLEVDGSTSSITIPSDKFSTDANAPTELTPVTLTNRQDSFTFTAGFDGEAWYSTDKTNVKGGTKLASGMKSGPISFPDGDLGNDLTQPVYICITKSDVDIYYKLDIEDPVAPKLNSLTVNGKAVGGDLIAHGTSDSPTPLTVELGPLDETFTLTAGFEGDWAKYSTETAAAAATGTDLTSSSPSAAIPITEAKTTVYLCVHRSGMNIYYELTVTRPEVEVTVPSEPTGTGMSGVADKEQTEQQLLTMADDIVSAVQAGQVPAGIDKTTADAIEKAIEDGKTITTKLIVDRNHSSNVAGKFEAALADGETIAQYLEIRIEVRSDGDLLGLIDETAKPFQFATVLSDEALANGVGFYVLRQHSSDIEKLPAQVSGNILTFSSDKFSDYAVAYTNSIADAVVDPIPDQTYTGSAITPALHVTTQAGMELKAGTDYTVTYKNNVQAGTATAVITGMGKFTGTLEVTFKILQPAAGGNSDKSVPNTGDGSPLLLWLTLLAVQSAALALIPLARKRRAACQAAPGAGVRNRRK